MGSAASTNAAAADGKAGEGEEGGQFKGSKDYQEGDALLEASPFDFGDATSDSKPHGGLFLDQNGADPDQKPDISASKLKRMALGTTGYMDQHRDYDPTLAKLDLNKTGTVLWEDAQSQQPSPEKIPGRNPNSSYHSLHPHNSSNQSLRHHMETSSAYSPVGTDYNAVSNRGARLAAAMTGSNKKSDPPYRGSVKSTLQMAGAMAAGQPTAYSPMGSSSPGPFQSPTGQRGVQMGSSNRSPPVNSVGTPPNVQSGMVSFTPNHANFIQQQQMQPPQMAMQQYPNQQSYHMQQQQQHLSHIHPSQQMKSSEQANYQSQPPFSSHGSMHAGAAPGQSANMSPIPHQGLKVRPFPRRGMQSNAPMGSSHRSSAGNTNSAAKPRGGSNKSSHIDSNTSTDSNDDEMIADFCSPSWRNQQQQEQREAHQHLSHNVNGVTVPSLPMDSPAMLAATNAAQVASAVVAGVSIPPSAVQQLRQTAPSANAHRPTVSVTSPISPSTSGSGIPHVSSHGSMTQQPLGPRRGTGDGMGNQQQAPPSFNNPEISATGNVGASTGAARQQQGPMRNAAPLPPRGGIQQHVPVVKETKDVKRNRAQLPTTMTHARPTTGDWLNKRYIVNNYILLDTLGTGSYGEVRLCKERTEDKLFAMKIISKDFLKKKKTGNTTETYFEDIKREIAIMKKLLHPNILRLFEVLDDPKVNKMYLVLEYMKMGDLIKVLKSRGEELQQQGAPKPDNPDGFVPLNDQELWHIFRQLVLGIKYLHRQNIVHGDIKPQNLLLREDGLLKIADFGISQMLADGGEKLSNAAGTPAFMAPELCNESKTFSGQQADVWAIGATMYMLRFGQPPFVAKSIISLYSKIVNDPLNFPPSVTIDPGLQNLLELILEKDPSKRLTLDQIMKHSWMMTMPLAAAAPPASKQSSRVSTATNNEKSAATPTMSKAGTPTEDLSRIESSGTLAAAANVARASSRLKQSMSFRPPDTYDAEEEAAMKAPVRTVDQKEVYMSIGGIMKVIEDVEYDSGSEDEDDEEEDVKPKKLFVPPKRAEVEAPPKIDESGSSCNSDDNDDGNAKDRDGGDMMATNWGDDVFGIVDDDVDDDDDSIDDDVDDDVNKSEKKDVVGKARASAVKSPLGEKKDSDDSSCTSEVKAHREMSEEEQAHRSMRFIKKNARKSEGNMKASVSNTGEKGVHISTNDRNKSSAETKKSASPMGERSFAPTVPRTGAVMSPSKPSLQLDANDASNPTHSRGKSERSMSPFSNSRSAKFSNDVRRNPSGRFNQSRDSMSRMSGISRDDLMDEETDQLTMEDFSRMMDTLAMQPDKINEEEDEALHAEVANLPIQGFCAELHNLDNGIAAAFNSEKGNRPHQEDRCVLIPNVNEMKALETAPHLRFDQQKLKQMEQFTMAFIFDGHNGWRCSHYLSQHFPSMLATHPMFLEKSIEAAILDTCERIDNMVCDFLNEEMDGAGSTGSVAIYDGRRHIFTFANVGDSVCVLSRGGKAIMLNRMHRLDNEEERERVKKAGGTVINNRVNGILAVSRAFGDTQFKASAPPFSGGVESRVNSPLRTTRSGLVISKPDVHVEHITPKTEFAILATDGLWDVMSPQMAVTSVRQKLHKHRDLEQAAKELTAEALSRGSVDNVTVMIMSFHYKGEEPSSKSHNRSA